MNMEEKISAPQIAHEIPVSVRFDYETLKELDLIALFERKKRAILCRDIIIEKIQVYNRNPAFKRFLKQYAASAAQKLGGKI